MRHFYGADYEIWAGFGRLATLKITDRAKVCHNCVLLSTRDLCIMTLTGKKSPFLESKTIKKYLAKTYLVSKIGKPRALTK